ncbi:hypothetical protein AB0C01_03260 [Micromonospora sp. NPDC048905]|uniref:hypothetical protein n=1 Tax=Micromonospora sp. NPDC048905 TaxID=3155494 RepID=UPI0033E471BE
MLAPADELLQLTAFFVRQPPCPYRLGQLDDCTAEQIAAFAASATYFELDDVADLIGRLDPDDALNHEYWDLSSSFGEDASLIRDALRCKLVEAPEDWG